MTFGYVQSVVCPIFRNIQGDVLFSAEQYQEAYIPYLEATQVWPSNPTYWILLCTTYVKLGWYVPLPPLVL